MNKIDLAYLAGVIDSDGTIGIKRNTYSMRVVGDSTQPTYSERICVKQVEPHAINLLRETFGGTLYYGKPGAKKGRRLYVWQVTDKKAFAALTAMLPFLRIKRKQAQACIDLRKIKEASKSLRVAKGRGHAGSAYRSPEMSAQMEALKILISELNKTGCEHFE